MIEKVNEEIEETPVEETINEEEQEEIGEEVAEPQPEVKPRSNDYQENLVTLRESKERERDRAIKAEYERDQLIAYFNAVKQQQQQSQPQHNLGLADDEYVEAKHLNPITNEVKTLKQEVDEYKEMLAELKLNNEYKDFNNVVTKQNVEILLRDNPELRSSILNDDSLYNRGKATYKLIKKFMNQPPSDQYQMSQKPRSSASVKGKSQLADIGLRASGYADEERKARLEREMYDAIDSY